MPTSVQDLYLDLVEKSILGLIYEDPSHGPWVKPIFDREARRRGHDWPLVAHSMIGEMRMQNLGKAVRYVLDNNVPGDFIETGVWRGGACIYIRAILKARGEEGRKVWVADSFEGLPKPNAELYPADAGDTHHTHEELAISLEEVKANFEKYGLLDHQVVFLKGWFKDTLPSAAIEKLAVLRLDGDMYESTMDALNALYHKVSPGGVIIVDDYYVVNACRVAITDFRSKHAIENPIQQIDGAGVYWIKEPAGISIL